MNIVLNGQPLTIKGDMNIIDFLAAHGYAGKTVAVALNGTFLPRGHYATTNLKAADNVEIVAPMQGG